jgi:SRSO17 transposase
MVLSQLTLYDINVTNILSTQINYDPLILSITQAKDRNNMIIANSVTIKNNILIETNHLLNNDIVYDWINYATTVGVDFFFSMATRNEREYTLEMSDNQIVYPISLVQPSYSRFVPYVTYDDETF